MKRVAALCVLTSLMLTALPAPAARAEGLTMSPVNHRIEAIGVAVAFPTGWTVVTPETVDGHLRYFDGQTAEVAAADMRTEGVYAAAFSPAGDAALRVIAQGGDDLVDLYYDIERYTSAMREDIRRHFLDKAAWELTGYRFSEAEWSNKEGRGRILNLKYTIRVGEETVARGRRAYTIRNGLAITLDLQVTGDRSVTGEEQKLFDTFVADAVFPVADDMPLMPVGLELTDAWPEETDKATFSVRGNTTKAANVGAWTIPEEGEPALIGQTKANNSGVFKLEMTLPEQGEYRIYVKAELNGFTPSEDSRWTSYVEGRLPVSFSERPEGVWTASQIMITGKTIGGVTIQCMEGDTNLKKTTGSGGDFSFKLDRAVTGPREVVLSLTKKGYDNRRFTISFDRQWTREDYVKYLSSRVEALSYKNLTEKAEKYVGRLVAYTGQVLDVSGAGERLYIQLGLKQDKDSGKWTERVIAVADGMEVLLQPGDRAELFIEVTTETYAFSDVTLEGDVVDIALPAVRLLTYDPK